MHRSIAFLMLFCLVLPAGAGAQEVLQPAPSAAQAPELLAQAVAAYEASDWGHAQTFFALAHAAQPTARTLRGLGVVAYRQGAYASAVELLTASLTHPDKPLTPELAAGVRELIAGAVAKLSTLTFAGMPDGTQVRVDGESSARAAANGLLLAPGQHRLELSANGHSPQTLLIAAAAGENLALAVDLPALPAATPSTPLPGGTGAAQPITGALPLHDKPAHVDSSERLHPAHDANALRPRRLRRAGYVLAGIAGAAGVTALVATALGVHRVRALEDQCRADPGGQCTPAELAVATGRQHLSRLSTLSIAGAVTAGVSGAAGATLWLSGSRRQHNGERREIAAIFGYRFTF